jgi:hypothetical protein
MVGRFLPNRGLVISCPPHSPDLAPVMSFIFPKVKTAPKTRDFQDVKRTKKNLTVQLNAVPSDAFYEVCCDKGKLL